MNIRSSGIVCVYEYAYMCVCVRMCVCVYMSVRVCVCFVESVHYLNELMCYVCACVKVFRPKCVLYMYS